MEGFVSNESSAFTLSDERDFEIEEKMRKSTPDTPGLFKKCHILTILWSWNHENSFL